MGRGNPRPFRKNPHYNVPDMLVGDWFELEFATGYQDLYGNGFRRNAKKKGYRIKFTWVRNDSCLSYGRVTRVE